MEPVYAVAGGAFIFTGVLIAIVIAIVFSYYTYRGSGINAHPNDGLDGAPGSDAPSQASGKGRSRGDEADEPGTGGGFSTRGTK